MSCARSLADHANDQACSRGSTHADEGNDYGGRALIWRDSVQQVVWVLRSSREQERGLRNEDDAEQRSDADDRFEPSVRFSE